ncbi:MAG: PDZ domain-containing protein, partial [Myxococcales bacterium]|nr:PDZ domain-containing protein [Myxococcales bacterium]
TLRHEAWQDLVRLGLRPDTEARVRAAHPDISGMLVVADTLPQGPGDGKVQPGDIVVELDGELVVDFVQVEEVIDARVGSEVALTVERLGQRVEVTLPVLDLHALTPARFLEVSRGILHDLSYQQARNHDQPLGGVYVASAGYMLGIAGIGSGALLLQIDGEPLATLDDAVRMLSTKA